MKSDAGSTVTILGVPVDEVDVIDFLHVADGWAAAIVDGATAGLTLTGIDGRAGYVTAPTEQIRQLLVLRMSAGPGPQSRGRTGDVADWAGRRPSFAPAGYRTGHTFPLRVDTDLIGTLDVFVPGRDNGFTARTVDMMQAVLDVAAWGLVRRPSGRRTSAPAAALLQQRLERRMRIEQAKGAIAGAQGCTVDEAFAVLREYARQGNLRLGAAAQDVLTTGVLLTGELSRPASGRAGRTPPP